MPTQPPEGPDADETLTCARSLLAEIRTISGEMTALAQAADTAKMAQLVMRRGQCVDQLTALSFDVLDDAARQSILTDLQAIESGDVGAEAGLRAIVTDIERRMLATHNSRKMLGEYRISSEAGQRQSTRTDRA